MGIWQTNKNMSKMKSKQITNENTQNIDNIVQTDIKITEKKSSLNQKIKELVHFSMYLLNDSNTCVKNVPYDKPAKLISLNSA